MAGLNGKSVLLIIGGGIAAYKALELIRALKKEGAATSAIMTRAAQEFVTPLSVGSLTGSKVHTDLFNLTDEVEMGHIELSRSADLVVVAPATADLMAKMANGLANDLASTTLLATDKRVLLAPAMNVRMWLNPATQRNFRQLMADGALCVGPTEGEMACGEFGPGRMADPAMIVEAIRAALTPAAQPLKGKHVLITAGPTREPIDPVRYISNHSSGKQGYAIAEAAIRMGAQVTLVSGPVSLPIPPGVGMIPVNTALEMLEAVQKSLPADIAIFSAAVADWRVAQQGSEKLKKDPSGKAPQLSFVENPDILKTIATAKTGRPRLVIGFAAETEKVLDHAKAKLGRKGCDLIVANDVSPENGVFGGDSNKVHLVSNAGVESWPQLSKAEVAERLMTHVAGLLAK